MTTNLTQWLDQLDEARAKATPGPWVMDSQGCCVLGDANRGPHAEFVTNRSTSPPDAALIVAEHNAAPELTAALRAVLDLAEEFDKRAMYGGALVWTRIRSTVAAALTPEATS